MSLSVSFGVVDTPVSGVTKLTLDRPVINFKQDYSIKNSNSAQVEIVNKKAPLSQPEKFRLSYSEVSNVYKGTGVEPATQSPSKRGLNILCQLTTVGHVTDAANPSLQVDLPFSVHAVIKAPAHAAVTGDLIQGLLARLMSGFYDTGVASTGRLNAIIRGSLEPSDL